MSDDEQQAAIAEFCGWKKKDGSNLWWNPNIKGSKVGCRIPDYLNDLNAMHEAFLMLSPKVFKDRFGFNWTLRIEFLKNLENIVIAKEERVECLDVIVNATSRDRAEALLHTIGKWRDQKPPETISGG